MFAAFKTGKSSQVSGYLPAILALLVFYLHIYFGLTHFEQRHQESQLLEFSQQATGLIEQMTLAEDVEHFWVSRLNSQFKNSPDYQTFLQSLQQDQKGSGLELPCVIWNANGKVVFNNHFNNRLTSNSLIEELYQDLNHVYTHGDKNANHLASRMKKLLGPHLNMVKLAVALYFRHIRFVRPDSAGKFANFWIGWGEKFASIVFFAGDNHNPNFGLMKFCQDFSKNGLHLGYIDAKDARSKNEHLSWVEEPIARIAAAGKSATIFQQRMVSGKRISGMKTLAIWKPYQKLLEPGKLALLLAIISLFGLTMLLKSSAAGLRVHRYSVKIQLLLMLLVTTGLPLFSILMITSDHVARKRAALIKNAYQTCIGYLQHVDQRSQLNQAHIINQVNKSVVEIKRGLPENFPNPAIFTKLNQRLSGCFTDIRLIASSPTIVLNLKGVYKDDKFKPFDTNVKVRNEALLELKEFKNLTAYYLSIINKQSIELKKLTETELIVEMLYQRPFHEVIQNIMLATDKVVNIGWGDQKNPTLVKLISLKNNLITDYFFMAMLHNSSLQKEFLKRQLSNLERNPLGLKFIYADPFSFVKNLTQISNDHWFDNISKNTRYHPEVEPCFTVMDGKDYVFAGMRAKNLREISLYAFYPLEKIDTQIAEERRVFMSAGIITIILLIGLAVVFSSSIVLPLIALKTGAIAIREKDFSFRFAQPGNDEFGDMARIFNSSIDDFEELSLAGIVQAKLLPQHEISDSRFDLFGKSVPMTELGGDYFDYFHVDSSNYVAMAGDVAGHGVGASLIMAMAKAGVMQCQNCLDNPAEVLAKLHQIIHETRSKVQRKVMTFQYLYFNADSGQGIYANAGACSPILVDIVKAETSEVTVSGPVLGGFKKSKFANLDLNIAPGQALVFYTDGIIEALNPEGREIGYEGFKQILLECHDADVKTYYQNIFDRYMQWLGGGQPQDDLTIIILARKCLV